MSMLSQDDRERLAEIEHHLTAEDPAFAARMRVPRRLRVPASLVVLVALAWVTVPVLAATADWAVAGIVLLIVIAVVAGRRLYRRIARRPRTTPS